MTLTEALDKWCEAVADAYMHELRGFDEEADEAREKVRKLEGG